MKEYLRSRRPTPTRTKSRSNLRRVLAEIFWEYEHGVPEGRDDESDRARLAEATERDMARRKVEE